MALQFLEAPRIRENESYSRFFYDSTMADYGVYKGMQAIYNLCGGKVVVDSAFKITEANYLIRSSQRDPDNPYGLRLNRQATLVRQLSEQGMRMVQGSFPRLKDALLHEEKGDTKVILTLMVHLYNFHCATIGINMIQIRIVKNEAPLIRENELYSI